jgi:hypothetical protein
MTHTLTAIGLTSLVCVLAWAATPRIEYTQSIHLDGERDTAEWDEPRWVEFLYRRMIGDNSYYGRTETRVPTSTGHIVDIFQRQEIAWDVCYDHDWRTAISNAMLGSVGLEAEPGVWLLVPDARRQHYLECQLAVQRLRYYGVPMHIQTLTIPVR